MKSLLLGSERKLQFGLALIRPQPFGVMPSARLGAAAGIDQGDPPAWLRRYARLRIEIKKDVAGSPAWSQPPNALVLALEWEAKIADIEWLLADSLKLQRAMATTHQNQRTHVPYAGFYFVALTLRTNSPALLQPNLYLHSFAVAEATKQMGVSGQAGGAACLPFPSHPWRHRKRDQPNNTPGECP